MSKGETVNFDVVLVVIQSTVLDNCCTSNAVFFIFVSQLLAFPCCT